MIQKYNVNELVYFEEAHDVRTAIARGKGIKKWRREQKNDLVAAVATKIRYILGFWCHCERSEAISPISRLLRRKAPRNDSFPLVGLRCI